MNTGRTSSQKEVCSSENQNLDTEGERVAPDTEGERVALESSDWCTAPGACFVFHMNFSSE